MATNVTHTPAPATGWFESFRRAGFYYQYAAISTILGGCYLHISRLFLGDDLILQYIFTPLFDRVLTVPMTYATIAGLLIWNRIQFRGLTHKIAYGASLFYIGASVPLHIWHAYLNNTTEYIRWFPIWWTIVLLPIYAGIIVLTWRLRLKDA